MLESGSEGTYSAQWDGRIDGIIPGEGICTIKVYDSAGNLFPATGTLTLSSAKSLSVLPNPFKIPDSTEAAITAEMATGQPLEARMGNIAVVNLTETDGVYSGTWDGKDSSGNLAPSGTYIVHPLEQGYQHNGTICRLRFYLKSLIPSHRTPPLLQALPSPAYVSAENITFAWTGIDDMPGALAYSYPPGWGRLVGIQRRHQPDV